MKICSQINCSREVRGRGLCNRHYLKYYRGKGISGLSRHERSIKYINDCIQSETDECMILEEDLKSDYPSIKINGVTRKIGQIVLERVYGLCPDGMEMRHLCGNSKCCNISHLKWDTHLENVKDQIVHGTRPNKFGSNNPNSKLSEEDREYIRRNYIRGKGPFYPSNVEHLARKFNITTAQVRVIAKKVKQ